VRPYARGEPFHRKMRPDVGADLRVCPKSGAHMGLDKGSVIAQPLFVNPKAGDFRVRRESPALKLGFEPFDLSCVGPRPDRKGMSD